MEALKQIGISAIRTLVPMLVGQIMGWVTAIGIVDTNGAIEAQLIAGLTILFSALYYIVVRVLEEKVSKKFGWLLGYATVPEYKD